MILGRVTTQCSLHQLAANGLYKPLPFASRRSSPEPPVSCSFVDSPVNTTPHNSHFLDSISCPLCNSEPYSLPPLSFLPAVPPLPLQFPWARRSQLQLSLPVLQMLLLSAYLALRHVIEAYIQSL